MNNCSIEKIAKELCDRSRCHHKCHDTTNCIVEDEAREYLPSTLTNEEKVSVKDKCIEEMANDLYENRPYSDLWEEDARDIAKVLYNAGYRKQSEGEWNDNIIGFCNVCMNCGAIVERSAIKNNSGKLNFCPNCGARMRGGE